MEILSYNAFFILDKIMEKINAYKMREQAFNKISLFYAKYNFSMYWYEVYTSFLPSGRSYEIRWNIGICEK